MWSDKITFKSAKRRQIHMTRCPNKKKCNICMKPACRIDRTNVMIWGGIGWNYKSPSVFLEKEDYIKWKYNYAFLTLVLKPIVFPYFDSLPKQEGESFLFHGRWGKGL